MAELEATAKQELPQGKIGLLEKQGRGKSMSFFRPWKKRTVQLVPKAGKLTYSDESGAVKGEVAINNCRAYKSAEKNYAFTVKTNKEEVVFAAANAEQCERWITAFNEGGQYKRIEAAKKAVENPALREMELQRQDALIDSAERKEKILEEQMHRAAAARPAVRHTMVATQESRAARQSTAALKAQLATEEVLSQYSQPAAKVTADEAEQMLQAALNDAARSQYEAGVGEDGGRISFELLESTLHEISPDGVESTAFFSEGNYEGREVEDTRVDVVADVNISDIEAGIVASRKAAMHLEMERHKAHLEEKAARDKEETKRIQEKSAKIVKVFDLTAHALLEGREFLKGTKNNRQKVAELGEQSSLANVVLAKLAKMRAENNGNTKNNNDNNNNNKNVPWVLR